MTNTSYEVTIDGDARLTFQANLADAAAPITVIADDGYELLSTPFQTADARHDANRAARLLNDWCRSEGGEAWGEDEDDSIDVTVAPLRTD